MKHIVGKEGETEELLVSLYQDLPGIRALLKERNLDLTRKAIRDSVNHDDFIIQTISMIESIDKASNALAKRFREWFAQYDPEREHAIADHETLLQRFLQKPEREGSVMGGGFPLGDVETLQSLAASISGLYSQRDDLARRLEELMRRHMPNTQCVAGTTIGAKLLAIAGSLERLSRMPSGTVQLLGAETALFRHLRKGSKPPKHGIIYNHQILQQAPKSARGKAARALADALSIAARIDFFGGEYMGEDLLEKIRRKMRRYET